MGHEIDFPVLREDTTRLQLVIDLTYHVLKSSAWVANARHIKGLEVAILENETRPIRTSLRILPALSSITAEAMYEDDHT